MLGEDLLELLYVRTIPTNEPRLPEAEFQEVGEDDYDDLGVSEWLAEEEGGPTMDQIVLYYQILRRPPVFGLYIWQWVLFGVAFSISLVMVTVSHIYQRLRGKTPLSKRPETQQHIHKKLVSHDEFQTPNSLDSDITKMSPSRLALTLLRHQFTAAQSAMGRKRVLPGLTQLCPPSNVQNNTMRTDNSYSSMSFSLSGRRWEVNDRQIGNSNLRINRQERNYGVGWGRLCDGGGSKFEAPGHRANVEDERLSSERFSYNNDRGNTAEATATDEFWSPLQHLSVLASSDVSTSGKLDAQHARRWPIWASPFLGLDIKSLFGGYLGCGLDNRGASESKQKSNAVKTERSGLNSSKIESFKRTTPMLLRGLRSIARLSRLIPGAPITPRIRRRRRSFGRVRPHPAFGATDNSTVSLEIATSDLLHGDFSKIRVKYSNSNEFADKDTKKVKPQKQQDRPSSNYRGSSSRSSISQFSACCVLTSKGTLKDSPVNQTRNRQRKLLHGKPPQPRYKQRKTSDAALGGEICVNTRKDVKVASEQTPIPQAEMEHPDRSLRQASIDKAGGTQSEIVMTSERSSISTQSQRNNRLSSGSVKVLQTNKIEPVQQHQERRDESRLRSDNNFMYRCNNSKVERRRTKNKRHFLEADACIKNRRFKRFRPFERLERLKYSSSESQRDGALSSSRTLSTEKRGSLTATTMCSNNRIDFKLKRKTRDTSSPEVIVKESLKEMRNQQNHKNRQQKLKTQPREKRISDEHYKNFPNSKPNKTTRDKEFANDKEINRDGDEKNEEEKDEKRDERAETNSVDERARRLNPRQHMLYQESTLPSSIADWAKQDVKKNTLAAWQNSRLENISEASGEIDDLLTSLITLSTSNYTCSKQQTNKRVTHSPGFHRFERFQGGQPQEVSRSRGHPREVSTLGRNTKVISNKQPTCDIRSKNPSTVQNSAYTTPHRLGRRTRQAIWKSNEKQDTDPNYIVSSISHPNDDLRLLQNGKSFGLPEPASKYKPNSDDIKHRSGQTGGHPGSSPYSVPKFDSCELGRLQNAQPHNKTIPRGVREKPRQKQSTKGRWTRSSHIGKTDHLVNSPHCAKETSAEIVSECDSSNIQHRLHMTVSLTSVLENQDSKFKGRTKSIIPEMSPRPVANLNTTHALSESISETSNRVAPISLDTRSRKRVETFSAHGDANACTKMSTTQSSKAELADNWPCRKLKTRTNKDEAKQRNAYNKKESEKLSRETSGSFMMGECIIPPAAGSSKPLQYETEKKQIPPSRKLSLKGCSPKHSPNDNGLGEIITQKENGIHHIIEQDIKSPVISFIAPKQKRTNNQALPKSPSWDRKRAHIHPTHNNGKKFSPEIPQHKNTVTEQPQHLKSSDFTTQLDVCTLIHRSLGEKENNSDEYKACQTASYEQEAAQLSKVRKSCLCSPRACRLHGSDVRLCENRPVQQTITHQQYTMKELQLAGYPFFKDDFGVSDKTASSRGNGSSWGKGQRNVPTSNTSFKIKNVGKNLSKAALEKKNSRVVCPLDETIGEDYNEVGFSVSSNKPVQSPSEIIKPVTNKGGFRSQTEKQRLIPLKPAAKAFGSFSSGKSQPAPEVGLKEPKAMSKRELMNQIRKKIGLGNQQPRPDKDTSLKANTTIRILTDGVKKTAITRAEPPLQRGNSTCFRRGRRPVWQKLKARRIWDDNANKHLVPNAGNIPPQGPENSEQLSKTKVAVGSSSANNRFHFGRLKSSRTSLEDSAMNLSNVDELLGAVSEVKDIGKEMKKGFREADTILQEPNKGVVSSNMSATIIFSSTGDHVISSHSTPQSPAMTRGTDTKHLYASSKQKSQGRPAVSLSRCSHKNKQAETQHVLNDINNQCEFSKQAEKNCNLDPQIHPIQSSNNFNERKVASNISLRQLGNSCSDSSALRNSECEKQSQSFCQHENLEEIAKTNHLQNEKSNSTQMACSKKENEDLDTKNTLQHPTTLKPRNRGPRLLSLARGMRRTNRESLQDNKKEMLRKTPEQLKLQKHRQWASAHKTVAHGEDERIPSKELLVLPPVSDKSTSFQKDAKLTSPTSFAKTEGKPSRRFDKPTVTSKAKMPKPILSDERKHAFKTKQIHTKQRNLTLFPTRRVNKTEMEEKAAVINNEQESPDFQHQSPLCLDRCVVAHTDRVELPNVSNIEVTSSHLPLQGLVDSDLLLACTQVDCEEATPYRKTKLEWSVLPQKVQNSHHTDSRKKDCDVLARSKRCPPHLEKTVRTPKTSEKLPSKENTHDALKQERYSEKGKLHKPKHSKHTDYTGVGEEKITCPLIQNHMATKCADARPPFNEDVVDERYNSKHFLLELSEMTSEENEKYKLPDSMPKMIGCSDASEKTLTQKDKLAGQSKNNEQASIEDTILQKGITFHEPSLVSSELKKPQMLTSKINQVSETKYKQPATFIDQTSVSTRFHSFSQTEANLGCAVHQSSGSTPELVGGSDASLGGMETPVNGETSKSGLSELAVAAVSSKGSKKPTELIGETCNESLSNSSKAAQMAKPLSLFVQESGRLDNAKMKGDSEVKKRMEDKLLVGENTEEHNELDTSSKAAAVLERTNNERKHNKNKPTVKGRCNENGELKRSKSQSQSQSWSLSRSHKSRSVGDSVTNTLERLTKRRLVSGRSHRRFGGSNSSPRPTAGLSTRQSVSENRRSPGTNSGSSDLALSPGQADGAATTTGPRKLLKRTRPRSQSLFAALGRAEETGYVASAAHHSRRRRRFESKLQSSSGTLPA